MGPKGIKMKILYQKLKIFCTKMEFSIPKRINIMKNYNILLKIYHLGSYTWFPSSASHINPKIAKNNISLPKMKKNIFFIFLEHIRALRAPKEKFPWFLPNPSGLRGNFALPQKLRKCKCPKTVLYNLLPGLKK